MLALLLIDFETRYSNMYAIPRPMKTRPQNNSTGIHLGVVR